MIITMLAVISKDGYITHNDDSDYAKWTSKSDQVFYLQSLRRFGLQFMGRKTYQSVKNRLRFDGQRLRVVFTSHPDRYVAVPHELDFITQTPRQAIDSYSNLGYNTAALVGGSDLYSQFLRAGLIDELLLTIEPIELGTGLPLFDTALPNALSHFELVSERPLGDSSSNGQTVVRHYRKKSS